MTILLKFIMAETTENYRSYKATAKAMQSECCYLASVVINFKLVYACLLKLPKLLSSKMARVVN